MIEATIPVEHTAEGQRMLARVNSENDPVELRSAARMARLMADAMERRADVLTGQEQRPQ